MYKKKQVGWISDSINYFSDYTPDAMIVPN